MSGRCESRLSKSADPMNIDDAYGFPLDILEVVQNAVRDTRTTSW